MRCLIGLLSADSGTVEVFGRRTDPHRPQWKRDIGYIGDMHVFYERWTGEQNLTFRSQFYPKRYRKELAVYAFGVALLLATVVTVGAWILIGRGAVPPPDDNFSVLYVFPTSTLFASFVPAIAALLGDSRERRVPAHAALPQSKAQVGLARVLTPAVFILLGLAAAEAMALVVGGGARWSFALDLAGMAGWALLCLQVAIFLAETSSLLAHSPGARWMIQAGVALLLIIYCAVEVAHLLDSASPVVAMLQVIPKIDRETFQGPLVLHVLAWLTAGLAFFVFMRRKSLTA